METQNHQESSTSKEDKPTLPPPPPLSPTTSPSHEFSFTISLHTTPNSTPNTFKFNNKTTLPPSSLLVDLAPADEIFFHGHLLPLHLLSRPSISPRPSDISIEDLSLPLDPISADQDQNQYHPYKENIKRQSNNNKPKSFLFGLMKWWKGSEPSDKVEDNYKKKKKKGFDVGRFLKKYASILEPLFFSSKGDKERSNLRRRPYSFSGHSNPKERNGLMRRRREFSAPASMRTSPTNSGLLSATTPPSSTTFSSSTESTMEELQSAIQAAIAHCKSSTNVKEDKCTW